MTLQEQKDQIAKSLNELYLKAQENSKKLKSKKDKTQLMQIALLLKTFSSSIEKYTFNNFLSSKDIAKTILTGSIYDNQAD